MSELLSQPEFLNGGVDATQKFQELINAASDETLARTPALTREAMAQVFERAASDVEIAADALMQVAIDRVADAKEIAKQLREFGAHHGKVVERAAGYARDIAALFAAEQKKITAMRVEGGAS